MFKEIDVEEFYEYLDSGSSILDIRTSDELNYGEIENAINIPVDQWNTQGENVLTTEIEEIFSKNEISADRKIVVVCRRGIASRDIAELLCDAGYDAVSLKGGYNAYMLSVVRNNSSNDIQSKAEQSLHTDFKESILDNFVKAVDKYELIKDGDRVAVCISGGKDSMLMAKLFQEYKKISNRDFDVEYLVMDPGYNEANRTIIEKNASSLGIPVHIYESDIFESVYTIEKSPCYLCARMRRGHLYTYAKELGCNKISLGHHYDDVIETILMGMLYGAQIQTMMPKLHSTNFEGMELIRPLYLIREDDIKAWRDHNGLRFIQCACKFTDTCTTCSEDGRSKSKRVEVKELIKRLKKTNPDVENSIFSSVENVDIDNIIAYKFMGDRHRFTEDNY